MISRPRLWWAAAATAALLTAAAWLRAPGVLPLVGCGLATVWCAWSTWRTRLTFPAIAFTVTLVAFVLTTSLAERDSNGFAQDPSGALVAVERQGTKALSDALTSEASALQALAARALDAPSESRQAFAALDMLRGPNPGRSLTLLRGGLPVAWSGAVMHSLDSLPAPVGVSITRFYLVMFAVAARGNERAVASMLVHAERPADALQLPFDAGIAEANGVLGFIYEDPSRVPSDSFAVVRAAGLSVLAVRALPPPIELLRERVLERGRDAGGIALAVALVLFIATAWRGAVVAGRLASLGVALLVIGVAPLSRYSNASMLFNAAYFFVPGGGPYAASVAALGVTAAVVLLGLLAAQRARLAPSARWQAVVTVLIVAGLGPFLLSAMARGMAYPQAGATSSLWIAWEVAIFLAALSVLFAGATAGQAALGRVQGLSLWIAPALAATATLAAPSEAVLTPDGGFAQWYTVPWVMAIGALAFTRRVRTTLLPTAIVAGCGALTLVWGQTVRARVVLADRDVASLSAPDTQVTDLLRRFPAVLDPQTAARDRVSLLGRFAASDLASGDLPVDVASWDSAGHRIADVRVGLAQGTTTGVDVFAREAADAMRTILVEAPGNPGVHQVLAYPHEDRTVTTVVVAPRTRLVTRDPYGALIGLGSEQAGEPPYTLRRSEAGANLFVSSGSRWERRGDDLHGDWFISGVGGRVYHVHAEVPLRDYGALVTRGALIVFADLAVLGALWLLIAFTDGGVLRWMRLRARAWPRSFRARLTIALFTFFVIPAVVFAAWSYRRLLDDDRQARDLLVRETLRGVAASTDSVSLPELSQRFETPLFLYANGVLVATSDALLDELLPTGRLLPPDAAKAMVPDEEFAGTADARVGTQTMRFGYRGAADTSAVRIVLGAPERTDQQALDTRRRDLTLFVLLATIVGALAALWLSGLAARQFARPIGALQRGAMALAAGEREPQLAGNPPLEFQPVFTAFRQMARDLEMSREQDARSQRVLAWGEMARQVAHEIKNPLTPMRLGVQHLQRAKDDPRVDFRQVLDENVARLLAEIDRLDEIARAFSRYGTEPDERLPAEAVDVAQAVHDVVRLEQMGAGSVHWNAEGTDVPVLVMARATELREVLLNLLENARLADAGNVSVVVARDTDHVALRVRDDGHGIAEDVLPRIFEPHFSTRTSGSGLGLAISRRLIESWGGRIAVESAPGSGTTVRITLVAPAGD